MAMYSVSRSSVALSTTNDLITIIAGANRRLRIHEVSIGGLGTASAANELQVSRATTGTTPGGAVTPNPTTTDAPAATFTTATTWAAQPSPTANLLRLPVNANGGLYRWVAKPGCELELRNSENMSFRSAVGTSTVSFHALIEEI